MSKCDQRRRLDALLDMDGVDAVVVAELAKDLERKLVAKFSSKDAPRASQPISAR